MNFAVYNTILGKIYIELDNKLVTVIKRVNDNTDNYGTPNDITDSVIAEINEYFNGKRKAFSFAYELRGTDFQKKVWQALTNIPYGETRSYKEIAIAIGNENASRAVGLANNKNPINIVVPCHRVIGANGKLVGYAGGLDMKEFLLEMEKKSK